MKQPIRLSLSVITGNCERDVERFLDTFKPHFDEVVMVRAVGSQTPDNTLYMAAERGCVIGEYKNPPDNDWPHVDDFAAARNASAALCTGDWIVWADMDDTAEGLEHIRTLIAKLIEGMKEDAAEKYGHPWDKFYNAALIEIRRRAAIEGGES